MKKFYITIILFCLVSNLFSQERPFRISLNMGQQNLIGINLEYVTKLMNQKFAPTIDFSSLSSIENQIDYKFTFIELGSNYYLSKNSNKGGYTHLSFSSTKFKGTYQDFSLGVGEGETNISSLNFKIGIKIGNKFFIRPELGYCLVINDPIVEVRYIDPSSTFMITILEQVPNFFLGGAVFNLGIGFSF